MADVQQALAASARPGTKPSGRSAFVIGNVGRLGEELLHAILEDPRYTRVAVGVSMAMRTVVSSFQPVPVPAQRDGWDAVRALGGAPEDLFVCLEPPRESFWKRATPYVAISSEEAVGLARLLRAAGTKRLAVVTPLEAMEQLGLGAMIRNADEVALVETHFERLVILRPSVEEQVGAGASVGESVANLLLRTLRGIMTPKRLQPLRRRRAAQVAVSALATLEDGVHVIGAGRLRELSGEDEG